MEVEERSCRMEERMVGKFYVGTVHKFFLSRLEGWWVGVSVVEANFSALWRETLAGWPPLNFFFCPSDWHGLIDAFSR